MSQPRAVILRIISGLRPEEAEDSPRRYAGTDVNASCPIRGLPNVIYSLIGKFLIESLSERQFVYYDYQQSRHPLLGRSHCATLLHEDCEQQIRVPPTVQQPWKKLSSRLHAAARRNDDCSIQWYKVASVADFEALSGEEQPFGLVPMCKPLNLAQLFDAVDDMCESDEGDERPLWFWNNVEHCAAVKVTIRLESQALQQWNTNKEECSALFGVTPVRQFQHGPQPPQHPLIVALGETLPLFAIRDVHRISVKISAVGSSHHKAELLVWCLDAANLARDAQLELQAIRNAEQIKRDSDRAEIARLRSELAAVAPLAKRQKLS